MGDYRERFGFGDLRPGRAYVMHVKNKNERAEFTSEASLCAAIDEQLRRDPDATIAVIQLPATVEGHVARAHAATEPEPAPAGA